MSAPELPPRAARLIRRADQWQRMGDAPAAQRALAEAAQLAPTHPDVIAARAAFARPVAVAPARIAPEPSAAAPAEPSLDAAAHVRVARAMRDSGHFKEALDSLRTACTLDPTHVDAWFNLGTLFFVAMKNEESRVTFERARRLDPTHVPNLMGLAVTLQTLGATDEAAARLRDAIAVEPMTVHAWQALTNLKTVRLSDAEVAQLEHVYASDSLTDDARAIAGFALADALERQKRYAEAYAVVENANALKRATIYWDAADFSRSIDALLDTFSGPVAACADRELGREVIFVVSLPRSGSTLTEQILSAHPTVESGGELPHLATVIHEETLRRGTEFPQWIVDATPADLERLGRRYLEQTKKYRTRGRFTDKGLSNWQLLGFLFAILPGAKVVYSHRAPIETCWSCYKQLFQVGQFFSYDIGELAAFWGDHDRLMRFWQQRYPGRIHDLVYEDLVNQPEASIRTLLERVDLPFDEACLNFHASERTIRTPSSAQVREPVRTDTARAPRYGSLLQPLQDALRRAGDHGDG